VENGAAADPCGPDYSLAIRRFSLRRAACIVNDVALEPITPAVSFTAQRPPGGSEASAAADARLEAAFCAGWGAAVAIDADMRMSTAARLASQAAQAAALADSKTWEGAWCEAQRGSVLDCLPWVPARL
jgi:hypothetical protein